MTAAGQRPLLSRLKPIDAVEGYYVASVLDFLHREGILAALATGHAAGEIARCRNFDHDLLLRILAYVSFRSDMIDRVDGDLFRIGAGYEGLAHAAHLFDQYIGGYGPCLGNLGAVLSDTTFGARQVDGVRHAAAFARSAADEEMPELMSIIEELGIRALLDIGCGGGGLLRGLSQRHDDFIGIGIDANPAAVSVARRAVADAGLEARIKIMQGDAFSSQLLEENLASVQAVTASSLLNAFFGRSGPGVDAFLRRLQALFPNRVLIVSDYYGALDSLHVDSVRFRRTLLHDLAQSVSGQGVPPASLSAWREIYAQSSCEIVQAFEGESAGIAWFIHIVQL